MDTYKARLKRTLLPTILRDWMKQKAIKTTQANIWREEF
jgi:hypothetical protein